MLVCKVENLFGENDYRCGRMAKHVITVGGINYLPLDAVKRIGFIYETKDIEDVEYEEPVKATKTTKNTTLAVSFDDLFMNDSYDKAWDKQAVEKDGVKYLTLDTLRETSLVIMPCDLQEIEV